MKRFASVLLLVAVAGGAVACPDEKKDAQAAPDSVKSKLADAQPQISRAPAATPSKSVIATREAAKPAPTTAAATKKPSSGG